MREVTVLLSINEHHLFNIYSIGVYLYLLSNLSANRVGIARRVAARRDEIFALRADKNVYRDPESRRISSGPQ